MRKLKFSVNPELINKITPKDKLFLANGFISVEGTIDELAQVIQDGWAFSYQYIDQKRCKANFEATDIVAIDVDNGWTIPEALENPVIKTYCALLYTTPSHTLDNHRYRLVFVLPRTLTEPNDVRAVQLALAQRVLGDLSATDPARMFYGNTEAFIEYLNQEITESFLDALIQDGKTSVISDSVYASKSVQTRSGLCLEESFEFRASDGRLIKFSEIDHKITIFCPFHPDDNPSAFVSLNHKQNRFMYCSTCRKTYWMGKPPEPFNFNEFEDAVRAYQANPPNLKTQGLNGLEELLLDNGIDQNKSITFTSSPYIELNEIPAGITFIKSPKGTGKTTFLKRALEKILFTFGSGSLEDFEENDDPESPSPFYSDKKVLLIGHRQALIREMCQRLSLECYLDSNDVKGNRSKKTNRYGVCLDSLFLVSNSGYYQKKQRNVIQYDLVILDESEQVLSHFLADTIGEKRAALFEDLKSLLQNAKSIVALDADLGWITFNTVTRLAKNEQAKQKPISIHINKWVPPAKDLYVQPKSSQLIDHIKTNVIAGKRIFVSSNSKAKVHALEKAIEELGSELQTKIKMISLTSENSKSKDVQTFIKNIKQEILKYQVILASPTLGTGIDITFDDNEELIDCVYGLYETRINTHTEIDQQLGRVRHPKEVHVWISPQRFNFETEFDVIKDEYLDNNFVASLFNQSDLEREVGVMGMEGISDFISMAALIVRYQRASKNQLKTNFLNYKTQSGWNIVDVPANEQAADAGNKFYKIGKTIVQNNYYDTLLNAKTIEKWQFEDIENRLDSNDLEVSRDEYHSFLKAKIELFYREPITQRLIELDNTGNWRSGIRIYEVITNSEKIRKLIKEKSLFTNNSQKQIKYRETLIYGFDSKCVLLYELMSATPFFKGFKFDCNVEYTSSDLERFTQLAIKLKPFIETHLKISLRKDFQQKPAQQLGQILKLVGLGHWKSKPHVVNGVKHYKYCLSKKLLDEIVVYAAKRSIHHNEWALYNERYGFKADVESCYDSPESGQDDLPDIFKMGIGSKKPLDTTGFKH